VLRNGPFTPLVLHTIDPAPRAQVPSTGQGPGPRRRRRD
jgi:hypothetical protein